MKTQQNQFKIQIRRTNFSIHQRRIFSPKYIKRNYLMKRKVSYSMARNEWVFVLFDSEEQLDKKTL